MAQKNICIYGEQILFKCKKNRYYFELDNINFDIDISNIFDIISKLSNKIGIDLSIYKLKYIKKNNLEGFNMKWHIDDVSIIKTKKKLTTNFTILADKYLLFHKEELPIYTAIIYLSDYGIDFTGGEFEFIDQQILPKKNYILFFDSKEVHRVLPVKNGVRNNILIKFYL